MISDAELLERYSRSQADEAFAEIVRRHLDFVYATALRQLGGDAHFAADASQQVFLAVARHASALAKTRALKGWLYTATRNAAANLVRTEQRRRAREQEAHRMQDFAHDATTADADPRDVRLALDRALGALSARERELVFLRFFEDRGYAEIGTRFAVTADAARLRVERALEKMRVALGRAGVVSTTGALAAALTSQASVVAPGGLAGSVAAAVLANATTLTTTTAGALGIFSAMNTAKFVAGAAATIALVSVGIALRQTLALREAHAATEVVAQGRDARARFSSSEAMRAAPPDSATARALTGRGPGNANGGGEDATRRSVRGQLQLETAVALQQPSVTEKYFGLMAVLQKLSVDNWREVVVAFAEERKLTGLVHPEAFELFVRRAGEVAGKDVVDFFLNNKSPEHANGAMMGWASKNPEAALLWLGREADAETRQNLLGGAIRGLALSEPDLAIKTLEEVPAKDRQKYTGELATSMIRAVGLERTQGLIDAMLARAAQAGSLKEPYLKSIFYDYSARRIQQSAATGNTNEAVNWLNEHVGQPYVDHQVIADAAARLARENHQETFRWLEGVNDRLLSAGDESTAGYRVWLDVWMRKDGAQAVESWLQGQASHRHYDHIAWQYAALLAGKDAKKATQWVNTIQSAAIKQEALRVIGTRAPARSKSSPGS